MLILGWCLALKLPFALAFAFLASNVSPGSNAHPLLLEDVGLLLKGVASRVLYPAALLAIF